MIELGGNIKLDGFENLEPALLIVVKKVVGNFARQYSEKTNVKELLINLEDKEKNKVSVKLQCDKEDIEESGKGDNLFYTLNGLLVKIKGKL